MKQVKRAHWSGQFAFILAAAGSAVGLGNIWKFPYITGMNGGGAFVLVYLLCIVAVGLPILIAELFVGQQGQANAVTSFENIHRPKTPWRFAGWLGLASAFLILSFYSVVGGWVLDFEFMALMGRFQGQDTEQIKGALGELFASPQRQLLWHLLFMTCTVGIVIMGVQKGLERFSKILMPILFVLLFVLLFQVLRMRGFEKAWNFLFSVNFDQLTAAGVLEAVGHSFFTLSLGMGAIMTYGSYLDRKENLVKISIAVALMDTFIALLAGLVIFSVVFSYDVEPGAGPGLMFQTLPVIFSQMDGGYLFAVMFFMLVAFAALTSAVSILEVVVAYWDEVHQVPRAKTSLLMGTGVAALGLLTVFSTNIMADVKVFGLTFFDLFDKLTSSYFLPIGGLMISLFFGWVVGDQAFERVLPNSKWWRAALRWSTRYVAPLAIVAILINLMIKG